MTKAYIKASLKSKPPQYFYTTIYILLTVDLEKYSSVSLKDLILTECII